jgi:hypothetical protein
MTEPEEVVHDIDHELLTAMYIIDRRIYDVLLRLLATMDEGAALELAQLHDQGLFYSPDPKWLGVE